MALSYLLSFLSAVARPLRAVSRLVLEAALCVDPGLRRWPQASSPVRGSVQSSVRPPPHLDPCFVVPSDPLASLAVGLAPGTVRQYRACWADFHKWCSARALRPAGAKPSDVVRYLQTFALEHPAKVVLVRSALSACYKAKALADPTSHPDVRAVGRSTASTRHRNKAVRPLRFAAASSLLAFFPVSPGLRDPWSQPTPSQYLVAFDHCLVALVYCAGCSREELTVLEWTDLLPLADSGGGPAPDHWLGLRVRTRRPDRAGSRDHYRLLFGVFACAVLDYRALCRRVGDPSALLSAAFSRPVAGARRFLFPVAPSLLTRRFAALSRLDGVPSGVTLRSGRAGLVLDLVERGVVRRHAETAAGLNPRGRSLAYPTLESLATGPVASVLASLDVPRI